MAAPATPPCISTARRDLLVLAALGLLTFALAQRFDFFERLVEVARRLEGMGLGAMIVAILALAFGLKIYAWRRWRETQRALSDRTHAKEALGASETRLRLLTRQIPAFLWTTDTNLRLTTFAGSGFHRSGIGPRGRVGLTVAAFFGVNDLAFPPLAAHRHALDGEPTEYSLHRDGREYEIRVEPLRDAAGAIGGTVGLGIDVTERAHTAATLHAHEARYRAVVEQAAEGIFLFEADSKRLIEANSALLRLLGYAAADLPTLTLYEIVAHDRASVDANIEQLIRTGRNSIGARDYRHRNGTTVPVEVSATTLTMPSGTALCVVVRDLTAHRAAEARRAADEACLREGNRRLCEAVDHAPLILFTLDRTGVVTFARGQGLETLGLTTEQTVGCSLFVAGRQFPKVLDNVRRALAGEAFDTLVTIGRHRFSVHYAPLHDSDGVIIGVIGVAANSTRRLRAEASVRCYAAGLTPHEQAALHLLATDLTQRQIAVQLCVGYQTIRTYLRRIAAKLDLDTAERTAVVAAAREQGLLGASDPGF